MDLPKHYDFKESEKKWTEYWEKHDVYKFDPSSKKEVYSIDTPPPTVSGKIHIGHAFSYTQQDFFVRFHRMRQKNIFYPFGTDNNGVATERLIESLKGVKAKEMDRDEFVKLCLDTVKTELIPKYVSGMKSLAISCDYNIFYSTIDEHSQRISQKSFIDLYKDGREYRKDAPTMWCPQCETGISQVECQDKELDSYFNDIVFKVDNEELIIATTRPELLPACVAVFYHPDDKRYQKYNGKKAVVPLFNLEVPILPDKRADPEKGTGIVMCCTFGDQTDMEWQKAHNLPIRMAITVDGNMTELAGKYKGMSIHTARKMMIEDMKDQRLLLTQEPIKHAVNVHERCGTEIEYIKSKQWFIKYLDLREDMLKWGAKLNWYPKHMKSRYDHWVKGLQWDWLISRQRYFGVPFPVWYCKSCDELILAKPEDLPVDPIKDKPPVEKCPECGSTEFVPDNDVMDTWATSSLTPNLAAELYIDKPIHKKLYPMSLRPQAHDIITFWLFNTVVKSQMHNNVNPWTDVAISGHALDPHGKKMSKSKGNVVDPYDVLENYGSDCLRFWAGGSKLGDDLPYQEKDLVTGKKFVTKLWNASKFAIMHLEDYDGKKPELELVDKWIMSKLHGIIKACTETFDKYEYAKTKLEAEKFFWHIICDNYLEIIKDRLYNPDKRGKKARKSAQYGLYQSINSVLKLMAPIMPFITEEIYHLYFSKHEKSRSIHISDWPKYDEKYISEKIDAIGDVLIYVVEKTRQAKTNQKLSLKAEVKRITVEAKIAATDFKEIEADIKGATNAQEIVFKRLDKKAKEDMLCDIEI